MTHITRIIIVALAALAIGAPVAIAMPTDASVTPQTGTAVPAQAGATDTPSACAQGTRAVHGPSGTGCTTSPTNDTELGVIALILTAGAGSLAIALSARAGAGRRRDRASSHARVVGTHLLTQRPLPARSRRVRRPERRRGEQPERCWPRRRDRLRRSGSVTGSCSRQGCSSPAIRAPSTSLGVWQRIRRFEPEAARPCRSAKARPVPDRPGASRRDCHRVRDSEACATACHASTCTANAGLLRLGRAAARPRCGKLGPVERPR